MSVYKLETMVLGMLQTNCYIMSNEDSKEAIVIDPADQAEKIESYLQENDLTCKGILLTHGHFDHILAVRELAEQTEAKIYAHREEAEVLKVPKLNVSTCTHREYSVVADIWLQDQEEMQLAGFTIQVIHTPGHTQGGVCYYFRDYRILFSGDTLFYGTIGRTDLPTGNGEKLVHSIKTKLMFLEDDVKVYPGHDISTTIGYERQNNSELN